MQFRSILLLALALPAVAAFAPSLRFSNSPQVNVAGRRPMGLQMSCPLVPLGSNVIVQMEEASTAEKKSASGILIAASVKAEGPKIGKIAAVGDGWHTEAGAKIAIEEVKVGDRVMFREPTSFENRKMKVEDDEFYVISVNDILAKIA
mmetsp:Transcript_1029/g.2405  ORF Transcript_1029/g.2405 Transcript_1029/m.2405 type:complete len:148 (-) Transcript_1029:114-557(-)|eukprot:CAMPEP_0177716636 /NCGR_PEP_ID=MMETSP0484_2-20121128/14611_1 /TAXON_ID=354590 /ORGANISM="Rhodomonas lens, Strain RHODO" /LENGTH=147 /DNA_ID=CAMNT_0019228671 /DNA_START=17 /DNA_END=460 /DNA_ORIENTATION=-